MSPLFVGGQLIRQYDGFRRLCRRAADEYSHPLVISEADRFLTNRVLAALGGPPAASEVRGHFTADALPFLLLFLLTQELPIRIGLRGKADAAISRLKTFVHLLGHAVYPMIAGKEPLSFAEVVKELGPSGAVLRPSVQYDLEGEPYAFALNRAVGHLYTGANLSPVTLAVLLGEHGPPLALESAVSNALHPTVLILT